MEEIYLLEENKDITFDSDKNEEWKKIIEELRLEGQKKLLENSGNKSAIPFMFMNTRLTRILECLCPVKVDVNKYDKTPIPLKILGVVKLCEQEGYFDTIQVWYDDVSIDPILVGYKNKEDKYLLARWGDMLRSFDELYEMAKKRWIEDNVGKA